MRDKLNGSRPTAFISSTFLDLERERKLVAAALTERGVLVNALEEIPASTKNSKEKILRGIEESDFVILILGTRYGSVLPGMTGSNEISVTQWEYNEARRQGKSILAYFMRWSPTDANRPEKLDDVKDISFRQKQEKLAQFKKIVSRLHSERYVSSGEELAEHVSKALIPVYRERLQTSLEDNVKLRRELEAATKANEGFIKLLQTLTAPYAQPQGTAESVAKSPGLLSHAQNAGSGLRSGVSTPPNANTTVNPLGLLQGLRGLNLDKK